MSSVQLTALALIGNPRQIDAKDKPKSILLDVELFLGAYGEISGGFRYYNANNINFEQVSICFVQAIFTKAQPDAKIASLSLGEDDYDILGDITWLILVTDKAAVDPRRLPWVSVSGTVKDTDGELTFKLNPEQWIPMEQSSIRLPILASIPDSPRYKDRKKPMPHRGSIISFSGFLTRIIKPKSNEPTENNDSTVNPDVTDVPAPGPSQNTKPHPSSPATIPPGSSAEWQFVVEVENLTFLARAEPSTPNTIGASRTLGKRKLGSSFSDWDSSPSPAPGAGKRRRENASSKSKA
ncbi:hypothetical protein BD410DRAFT_846015 [Rickenella mellea]|uniref:Uncharacterized protein n=1 Tax=Rickenella mellea TaxID=50990 RepID=A0A4Y7PGC2_9AGAM|nr:hypothetical protein BD410DRAFT_846015 [Rickenella mellea]